VSNGASTALAARTEIGYRMSAVFAIAQRDLTKLLRDRLRMAVNLAFPVTLIVGLGHVLEPTVGQITGLNAVTLALTGVLAATMFQSAAAGMISLVEDRETDFAREMFIAPLSRITLMGGKIVGETLVALCQGGFIVVFALVFGVQVSLGQVVAELGPCIACCLLGAAFGLATLSALPNQRAAMQVFQFLIIPQYVLGGVIAPLHSLPIWLNALAWAMPLRYGVELARAAFYANTRGYAQVVTVGPLADVAIMSGLFAALLVTGASVWERREHSR
jgi:ABC-2 type transport system permease protein